MKPTIMPLVLAAMLAAQDPPARSEAVSTPEEAYKQLQTELREAQKQWQQKVQEEAAKAKEAGKPMRIDPAGDPRVSFLPRFVAAAKEHAGKDGVVPILQWIVDSDNEGAASQAALRQLLKDHLQSDKLGRTAQGLYMRARSLGDGLVRDTYAQLIEKNPSPDVKASAYFGRANLDAGRYGNAKPSAEQLASAAADLKSAIKLAPKSQAGRSAEGFLYELEHLQIGMVAPEISGVDLEGKPMKLSEFRGTVLMLDFWGDW